MLFFYYQYIINFLFSLSYPILAAIFGGENNKAAIEEILEKKRKKRGQD
jgi:hypothetical protein